MTARRSAYATPRESLEFDLQFLQSVLSRFPDPWQRYFLTLHLEVTADALEKIHVKRTDRSEGSAGARPKSVARRPRHKRA
jgi:hypothetical protein